MSAKEKYPELYKKAALLQRQTDILKMHSWLYYVFFSFMLLMPLFLLLLLIVGNYSSVSEGYPFTKYVVFALYFLLLIVIVDWEKRLFGKILRLFEDAQNLCGELSDMIDWTTMRRRQIYNTLSTELQGPIDSFYTYTLSRLCPFYGGRRLKTAIFIILLVEAVGVFVYSLISLL